MKTTTSKQILLAYAIPILSLIGLLVYLPSIIPYLVTTQLAWLGLIILLWLKNSKTPTTHGDNMKGRVCTIISSQIALAVLTSCIIAFVIYLSNSNQDEPIRLIHSHELSYGYILSSLTGIGLSLLMFYKKNRLSQHITMRETISPYINDQSSDAQHGYFNIATNYIKGLVHLSFSLPFCIIIFFIFEAALGIDRSFHLPGPQYYSLLIGLLLSTYFLLRLKKQTNKRWHQAKFYTTMICLLPVMITIICLLCYSLLNHSLEEMTPSSRIIEFNYDTASLLNYFWLFMVPPVATLTASLSTSQTIRGHLYRILIAPIIIAIVLYCYPNLILHLAERPDCICLLTTISTAYLLYLLNQPQHQAPLTYCRIIKGENQLSDPARAHFHIKQSGMLVCLLWIIFIYPIFIFLTATQVILIPIIYAVAAVLHTKAIIKNKTA